ncbi:MAG TPA: hypothetical protein VMQ76_10745 [Terracidiphilus sp.]|jgi:hypothetical protein|nr:hypothetical protein [Terracidiphilus sp.]
MNAKLLWLVLAGVGGYFLWKQYGSGSNASKTGNNKTILQNKGAGQSPATMSNSQPKALNTLQDALKSAGINLNLTSGGSGAGGAMDASGLARSVSNLFSSIFGGKSGSSSGSGSSSDYKSTATELSSHSTLSDAELNDAYYQDAYNQDYSTPGGVDSYNQGYDSVPGVDDSGSGFASDLGFA